MHNNFKPLTLAMVAAIALIEASFLGFAFSQVSNDVAQKSETLRELQTDYQILTSTIVYNQQEYKSILVPFCSGNVPQAILNARKTYCNQKVTEFNSRDADLRAQVQKLAQSITQLNAQIAGLQNPKPAGK